MDFQNMSKAAGYGSVGCWRRCGSENDRDCVVLRSQTRSASPYRRAPAHFARAFSGEAISSIEV